MDKVILDYMERVITRRPKNVKIKDLRSITKTKFGKNCGFEQHLTQLIIDRRIFVGDEFTTREQKLAVSKVASKSNNVRVFKEDEIILEMIRRTEQGFLSLTLISARRKRTGNTKIIRSIVSSSRRLKLKGGFVYEVQT